MILFRETGRPEIVYGKSAVDLEHSVLVTEAELLIGCDFQRNARVGSAIADGMFIRSQTKLYVEVDNETMTIKQMKEKWERYMEKKDEFEGFILLICRTTGRLKRLIRSAERVKRFIFFSRFHWLEKKHGAGRWIDSWCQRAEF